ncbi:transposase [Amphritea pacifica]|uniref:Transposase n=1 Tax=Amphritea pacifica TaxID=2811233 RepID=A0ABS2WEA5_9GAMM|nr:transposase [Amphritea pacifica]MBN0989832.1 transposase [Amphritea pacifica]
MTRARNQIISTVDTPYYHCIARCVRRAFLCGEDPLTGRSYEHRRQWAIDRLALLQQVFCIDLCAYAVMSNHYHLVLCINESAAEVLTTDEVIERWCLLYKGPLLIQRYREGASLGKAEYKAIAEIVELWRSRLTDISWFMRSLNEHIARQANKEDRCKGHFWESRFKSQALLDDKALLTCMAYVDLNPIRAGLAETPERSDFTSVQLRISTLTEPTLLAPLALRSFDPRQDAVDAISYDFNDYLELVDYSGRAIRDDKRGYIPSSYPSILQRLDIDQDSWIKAMRPQGIHFSTVLGDSEHLKNYLAHRRQNYIVGSASLKRLLQ